MKKTIALAAGLVALLGLTSLATAQAPEQDWHGSLVFFFGDCHSDANGSRVDSEVSANLVSGNCSGIGMFWGDWNEESLANGISEEAADRFGGNWRVTKLKAYDLVWRETIFDRHKGAEFPCGFTSTDRSFEFGHIAFWVAWFSVEPCTPAPSGFGETEPVAGNDSPGAVRLVSDDNPGYGGLSFFVPEGLTFGQLTQLSSDFMMDADDNCAGGSPRFELKIDENGNGIEEPNATDGNIFVYFGTAPAPACTPGAWQNTTDLLETGYFVDSSQLTMGEQINPYANALASYGNLRIWQISLIVDSGWAFPDLEQAVTIDNTNINGTVFDYE